MTKYHQFEVLRSLRAVVEHRERQDAPNHDVQDGQSQAHGLPETVESENDSRVLSTAPPVRQERPAHRGNRILAPHTRGAVAITGCAGTRRPEGVRRLRDNRKCIEASSRRRAPGRANAAEATYVLTSATIALPER
jgi:hypothetical protein